MAAILRASPMPPVLPGSGCRMAAACSSRYAAEAVTRVEALADGDRHLKPVGDALQGLMVRRLDRLLQEHEVVVLHAPSESNYGVRRQLRTEVHHEVDVPAGGVAHRLDARHRQIGATKAISMALMPA